MAIKIANTEVGEVLLTDFFSESTNRSARVYRTHEDYRIEFEENGIVYEDWRDSEREAEDAAEDWVMNLIE